MPLLHHLSDTAARALTGSVIGGAAGMGVGAVTAPSGERKARAKTYARTGAALGAAQGVLDGFLRARNVGDVATHQQHVADLAKLQTLASHHGTPTPDVDRAVGLHKWLIEHGSRSRTSSAQRSGAAALSGTAMAALVRRFRRGSSEKSALARSPVSVYEGNNADDKLAALISSGANISLPATEEPPRERRARRLAELLKQIQPTSLSGGGSASPAPSRGTP